MEIVFGIFAIVFGLCFGSFLNVLIIRIPLNKSVILPASACMNCGRELRFYHNIPVFSFLFLRGKCGFCGSKISPIYPIIESISGIFGFFIYMKFGFSPQAAFIGISLLLLFALSIIDLKTKEVPDSLNFSAFIFALIGGILHHSDFMFIVASAFSLAGFFTLLRFALQSTLKKEALGEGDIIVVATMGALLGWKLAFIAVFLSAVFSLIILLAIRKKDYQIPYIPFLLLGTLPCVFFDNFIITLLELYMSQI